ncbi:polyprenol phosphomannose-dependent alpha 1,6 mannosyltransferase MptB [Dactylosporangium sp. NBC_01737]|uniref:polyprenol phosphomannose-dependent alpha 1,6 mannosyltransferase MptB n=1 Tax=Dactylosporangium sp. NBC_01737 TaxID=2975959 RepID=UPI002E14B0F2|nr:polyprenol phosphomannose-dependent alpha 1,6 mannosyltransferase MptB [Dactylosporangium sp. NBC_01737]
MSVNPRWLGLAATVLLAASGFLAGKPVPHDGAWLLGVVVWFVALAMLIRAWWTLRAETDQRGLLLTAALWSVPLLFAPPLGSHDVYAYACQGQLFNAGLDLYRVGPAELPCTWLSDVPELWRETPTPYGPLWIAVEGAAAWLAHGSLPAVVLLLRVAALLGLLLCIAAVHRLSRGNALLAASPLVLVHVVSGAHNDVVLAGLVLAGFVAARRPGPVAGAASGVAFGLAVAVKVTAIAAAPFALLLLFFAGTTRARWTAPAAFAGAAGAAYAILALLTGHGLGFLHALGSTSTMVQWLSVPTGVGMAAGYVLRVAGRPEWFATAVAVARAAGLLALAAILLALWWRAARTLATLGRDGRDGGATGRRGQDVVLTAAGVGMLAVAVLGPVFYAWYAIGGIALLAGTTLTGRLRTVVHVAAAGLPLLTLPDSLGLATKTKVPGAFLDVALVTAATVHLLRRRRGGLTSPAAPPAAADSPAATERT